MTLRHVYYLCSTAITLNDGIKKERDNNEVAIYKDKRMAEMPVAFSYERSFTGADICNARRLAG